MSNTINQVIFIEHADLKKLKYDHEEFLLCFANGKNIKNSKILNNCDYFCTIYKSVKCRAIHWNTYKSIYRKTKEEKCFMILRFNGKKEISQVNGRDKLAVQNLFSEIQNVCDHKYQKTQKLKQKRKNKQSEKSSVEKTKSGVSNEDCLVVDKGSVSQHSELKSSISTTCMSQHLVPRLPSSNILPQPAKCKMSMECNITKVQGSRLCISDSRSSASSSKPKYFPVHSVITLGSNSSSISHPPKPPPIPKSLPTEKSETLKGPSHSKTAPAKKIIYPPKYPKRPQCRSVDSQSSISHQHSLEPYEAPQQTRCHLPVGIVKDPMSGNSSYYMAQSKFSQPGLIQTTQSHTQIIRSSLNQPSITTTCNILTPSGRISTSCKSQKKENNLH